MSIKDFELGMVVGAKPYEEVYKKQEEVLHRVADNLNRNLDSLHEVADVFIQYMNDQQRKELYDLNAPSIDLKELEQEEKEYLLSGLYTLAAQCKSGSPSPFQKIFIRSIQNYLGIKKPQIVINMSKVASVDSTKKQRAIMQVFMEYLFLEKEDFTFLTDYASVFVDFSINEKDRESILQSIDNVYKAVDALGFIDKYGFVPETPEGENDIDQDTDSVVLEPLAIDTILAIPADREKLFYAKEVCFNADIHCEGKLIFDQCVIKYDYNKIVHKIIIGKMGSVNILNSTIIGACGGELQENLGDYFIETDVYHNSPLTIKDSFFKDCYLFAHNVKAFLENCKIQFSFFPSQKTRRCWKFIEAWGEESEVKNCLIENSINWKEKQEKFLEIKNLGISGEIDEIIGEGRLRELFNMPKEQFSLEDIEKVIDEIDSSGPGDSLFSNIGIIEGTTFNNIKQQCLYKVQRITNWTVPH
jgi:hypothetical protein